MESDKGFGERLKEAIKKAGLTQRQVSQILGISKNTMTNYVRGITQPKGELLIKLATLLNVDPEWLVAGKERISIGGTLSSRVEEMYEERKEEPGFARRFADSLKEASLDPAGLAELAGVDRAVVESALAGRLPDAVTLCRLARALGTTVEWLVTGEDPNTPAPQRRAREPDNIDPLRIMAAVAALDKEEIKSYLKGEIPSDTFLERISETAYIPGTAIKGALRNWYRASMCNEDNKEEAATSDLTREIETLLHYWTELTEEERRHLMEIATNYYARRVARGKSGSLKELQEETLESPTVSKAEGF